MKTMKNLITSFSAITVLFLLPLLTLAQSPLEKADQLIEERKYKTAFELLEQEDPENEDPDIALKKLLIAQNFFAQSMMHQMFAFQNLSPEDDIMEIRRAAGGATFTMYNFPAQEIFDNLIEKNPDRYDLHQAIGNFFFEVHLKYGDNWVMSTPEVLGNMYEYCKAAADHDQADYMTYYCLGYYQTLQEEYDAAIPHYLKSITLNSEYPTSHYNLAICYFYKQQSMKGIPFAERSFQLYEDPNLKGDAARVTANLYKDTEQLEKALEYYELSVKIQPDNYYNLSQLLEMQLRLDQTEAAQPTADALLALAPTNPKIASDLCDIFAANEKGAGLISFMDRSREKYKEDPEVLGSLDFYLGQYYLAEEQPEKAKATLLEAKKNFEKVFEEDHEVFPLIEEILADLNE